MKFLLIGTVMLMTAGANAATLMGAEAVEMFSVLSRPSIQECMQKADLSMVNIQIEKEVFRCPGCVNYTISGNKLNIDIVEPEKTVIVIKGRQVPGTFFGWVQTYTCSVEN